MNLDIPQPWLARGGHDYPSEGMCAMEMIAFMEGEQHSDAPACVCPLLGFYVRSLNDSLDDVDRQRLLPYLARLANSNRPELVTARAEYLRDAGYQVAVFLLGAHGKELRRVSRKRAWPLVVDLQAKLRSEPLKNCKALCITFVLEAITGGTNQHAAARIGSLMDRQPEWGLRILEGVLQIGQPTQPQGEKDEQLACIHC